MSWMNFLCWGYVVHWSWDRGGGYSIALFIFLDLELTLFWQWVLFLHFFTNPLLLILHCLFSSIPFLHPRHQVGIRETYILFPWLFANTSFYCLGRCCWQLSWRARVGWDQRVVPWWLLARPIHRRLGSIDFATLNRSMITVKANATIIVDVGMKHLVEEFDFGWSIGIFLCEL